MMYELTNEQKEFLRRIIEICIRKCEGIESKTGDRAIFVHIIKSCLNENTKGIIPESEISIVPVRINELVIYAYGQEILKINLKSDKGKSYIDLEDKEYTFEWKI